MATQSPTTLISPTLRGQQLRDFMRQEKIDILGAYVAISEADCVLRYFEMPPLPKKEIAGAVKFEAQKYLPFELKDLYFDYRTQTLPNKKNAVMFLAARKTVVENAIDTLREAGVKDFVVEPSLISLARVFQPDLALRPSETTMVVFISEEYYAHIIVIQNHLILSTYNFSFHHLADSPQKDSEIPDAIHDSIRVSLNYFAKNLKDKRIDRILFCGEKAFTNEDFIKNIGGEFAVPVQFKNPLNNFGAVDSAIGSGNLFASGAALRNIIEESALSINLVPTIRPTVRAQGVAVEEPELVRSWAIKAAMVTLCVWTLIFWFMSKQVTAKEAGVNQVRASLPASWAGKTDANFMNELNAKEQRMNMQLQLLKQNTVSRIYLTEKMNEVARQTPAGIKLTSFDYSLTDEGGAELASLKLEGRSTGSDQKTALTLINDFLKALSADTVFMKGFKEVRLASVQNLETEQGASTRFVLLCK